jgi:hypothetical protein
MLYQLIKKLHPGIQQTHLTMECVVGQTLTEGENPRNVQTDIKFVKGADTLYIDIAVVDPAAATYMQTPTSLWRTPPEAGFEPGAKPHARGGVRTRGKAPKESMLYQEAYG